MQYLQKAWTFRTPGVAVLVVGLLVGPSSVSHAGSKGVLTPAILRTLAPNRHAPLGPVSAAGKTYYQYGFEGHVHTVHSRDADHPVVTVLAGAEFVGLDAVVITDHGSTRSKHDVGAYHGKLVPFVGQEVGGTFGHAVMWNVTKDDRRDPLHTTLNQRADFAHSHGGLLVLAHPGWWIHGNSRDPMTWLTPAAVRHGGPSGNIDAVEIWNGVYRTPLPKLINAWVSLLEAGVYVPIVGNSDFHRFSEHHLGTPRNVAYCDTPDISTCLWPAVQQGRLYITDGPSLLFTVNDQLPGSIIVAQPGSVLQVHAEAVAPEGGELRVYLGGQQVQSVLLAPGARGTMSLSVPAPQTDTFLRVDIARPNEGRGQTPVSLLSNPVLVSVSPTKVWR